MNWMDTIVNTIDSITNWCNNTTITAGQLIAAATLIALAVALVIAIVKDEPLVYVYPKYGEAYMVCLRRGKVKIRREK